MKKMYQQLLLLFVGLLLFNACSQESNSHLKVIPSNAAFVASIQAKQIAQKSGLDNPKQYNVFQKIMGENENQILSKYIENPKETGLKNESFYIFGIPYTYTTVESHLNYEEGEDKPIIVEKEQDKPGMMFGCSFLVSDDSKLETFLGEMWKEKYNKLPIEEKPNYKIIKDNDLTVLWNKELCLIFSSTPDSTDYDKFFTLTPEQSVTGVPDFQEFQKQSTDIAVWVAQDKVASYFLSVANTLNYPKYLLEDVKDIYIHLYAEFKDNEIKVTGRMSPAAKVEEYLAKYPIIKKDFNQALLEDFPKTSYFTYKFSFNFDEYIKLMQKMFADSTEDNYNNKMLLETLEHPNAKIIINALGGDAVLSIYDFARGGLPIPLAGLSFTVKSEDAFKDLMTLLPEGMTRQNGNYYVVPVGGMVSIYFAYKENRVYVTNDVDAITNFTGKGFDSKLSSHALGSDLKKSPYLFYINLDIDSYPEDIKNFLLKIGETTLSELKIYKDLTMKITDKNEMECSLRFKSSSENSLRQLLKCIDNISSQYN